MEISRKSCRLCLSETEFNVSLYGNYCERTNMVDKILVCLKIVIEKTDTLNTICYKCAENIERYYNFVMSVKKSQTRLVEPRQKIETSPVSRRNVSVKYVREQVFDADYTFSFLEIPSNDDKKENKYSSPMFSYFSPPNLVVKRSGNDHVWKTPRPRRDDLEKEDVRHDKRHSKSGSRQNSRDLFESQSQDKEDELKVFDWKLTPDDNIIKRIREKCFEQSDF